MSDWADTKVTKYSKGMKQRVGLAQSMLGNPPVVFLDEPTDGVDPVGRAELRDAIREYADGGSTVFLNSHILDEVEKVCDQIAILHKGAVIEQGDVEAVKNRIAAMSEGGDTTVTFRTGSMGESTFKGYASRGAARVDDHRFTVSLGGDAEVNQWVDRLRSDGIENLCHRARLDRSRRGIHRTHRRPGRKRRGRDPVVNEILAIIGDTWRQSSKAGRLPHHDHPPGHRRGGGNRLADNRRGRGG